MDSHITLALFHILAVAPLFLFVAFMRSSTPTWVYLLITGLGLLILVYHGYKLMTRIKAGSSYVWVNAIHVLFVAPLLIFVGTKQVDAPRYSYELLALVGFSALGYHMYSLIREIQLIDVREK